MGSNSMWCAEAFSGKMMCAHIRNTDLEQKHPSTKQLCKLVPATAEGGKAAPSVRRSFLRV
eukprot:11493317-Prorocentrum_lima.AAC.1